VEFLQIFSLAGCHVSCADLGFAPGGKTKRKKKKLLIAALNKQLLPCVTPEIKTVQELR